MNDTTKNLTIFGVVLGGAGLVVAIHRKSLPAQAQATSQEAYNSPLYGASYPASNWEQSAPVMQSVQPAAQGNITIGGSPVYMTYNYPPAVAAPALVNPANMQPTPTASIPVSIISGSMGCSGSCGGCNGCGSSKNVTPLSQVKTYSETLAAAYTNLLSSKLVSQKKTQLSKPQVMFSSVSDNQSFGNPNNQVGFLPNVY